MRSLGSPAAEILRLDFSKLGNPAEAARIFERMYRLRDAKGVYAEGGCMDTTREAVRFMRPETCEMVMPGVY